MSKVLRFSLILAMLVYLPVFSQTEEWSTDYVTFDDAANGTGDQTSSVAAIGPNRFVALVTETPSDLMPENLFNPPGNHLVGYWDADSGMGRVPAPINGEPAHPEYGGTGKFTDWEYVLDKVTLKGAWQIAADDSGYIYVANNDDEHNILVFQLTAEGVVATPYRMVTGSEYIFGIEVDTNEYVYVVDYEGSDSKTDEVKVFAGIHAEGTTWGEFGGHNDEPVTTIDLPAGIYQGITVSSDGTQLFISASSERSIWKFVGDPENGYTQDPEFSYTLAEDDTIGNGGSGTPTILGLGYLDDPQVVFAAIDTFIVPGLSGGYPYGRIYAIDANGAGVLDTIDIAEWNLQRTFSYDSGSNNGRAGGFTSVCDVDVEPVESAVYTQTYYGWAVEKWVFDGDLHVLGIRQISSHTPESFNLSPNYPNPFNPATTIEFAVEKAGHISLEVFNVRGQKVATLVNERMMPGTYEVTFEAVNLPSGVYFYQITGEQHKMTRKMVLMK